MGVASAIPRPGAGASYYGEDLIRLMVVDDSVTARTVFSRIISREDDMELVVEAATAEEALEILTVADVDVILLDLEMPGMGGLQAMPQLIQAAPGAQIMVVSGLTVEGAEPTLAALSLGAADTLAKPRPGLFDQDYRDRLLGKIRALGGKADPVVARYAAQAPKPAAPALRPASGQRPQVLAIGASTGGIHALAVLFNALPRKLDMPILVTQHLPGSFMDAFARQLTQASGRPASLAADGTVLQNDHILVAPGNAHMTIVEAGGRLKVKLDKTPATSGCMPSVDPMFASLAESVGAQALGIVLSGMGRDGTLGAGKIAAAGGSILVQDEATCAVWGMPGSVALAGLASCVLPPEQIAGRIAAMAKVQ
jgi:two-component system chemotaxis response regulator CheB